MSGGWGVKTKKKKKKKKKKQNNKKKNRRQKQKENKLPIGNFINYMHCLYSKYLYKLSFIALNYFNEFMEFKHKL